MSDYRTQFKKWVGVDAEVQKAEAQTPDFHAYRNPNIPVALYNAVVRDNAFDRGFLHAMGVSLLLVLCLLPVPAHARKRNKIIAIGAAVGGAIVAGALASTGNQSQQPATRQVVAHHGMRH